MKTMAQPLEPATLQLNPNGPGVVRTPPPAKFKTPEKALLCQWAHDSEKRGEPVDSKLLRKFAKRLKVDPRRVQGWWHRTTNTEALARRLAGAEIAGLTERTFRAATVAEGMELMHRQGTLSKPVVETHRENGVTVVVGMPGKPALIPPTDDDVRAAEAKRASQAKVIAKKPDLPSGLVQLAAPVVNAPTPGKPHAG